MGKVVAFTSVTLDVDAGPRPDGRAHTRELRARRVGGLWGAKIRVPRVIHAGR
jgi:hypothetical protein